MQKSFKYPTIYVFVRHSKEKFYSVGPDAVEELKKALDTVEASKLNEAKKAEFVQVLSTIVLVG